MRRLPCPHFQYLNKGGCSWIKRLDWSGSRWLVVGIRITWGSLASTSCSAHTATTTFVLCACCATSAKRQTCSFLASIVACAVRACTQKTSARIGCCRRGLTATATAPCAPPSSSASCRTREEPKCKSIGVGWRRFRRVCPLTS